MVVVMVVRFVSAVVIVLMRHGYVLSAERSSVYGEMESRLKLERTV